MRRIILAAAAASSLAFALAPPARAALPATLTGEELTGIPTVTAMNCQRLATSTYSYRVTGLAAGPYPGVFEETGTVTFGPAGSTIPGAVMPVRHLTATFRIDSVAGEVRGTKSLITDDPASIANLGICVVTSDGELAATHALVSYEATITTATGTFHDEGRSDIDLWVSGPTLGSGFVETFVSSLTDVVPLITPPGNSPLEQPGKGCGDRNHIHAQVGLCK